MLLYNEITITVPISYAGREDDKASDMKNAQNGPLFQTRESFYPASLPVCSPSLLPFLLSLTSCLSQ